MMTTLPQRGPLSAQLVPRELPGAVKQVPARALALSAAALLLAAWGAFAPPEILQDYDTLLWMLALVPAFMYAYYRGWRGAMTAIGVGMVVLILMALLAAPVFGTPVDWLLLLSVAVIFLGVGFGIGIVSELLQRERSAALVLAFSDPLTGLPNRRLIDFVLEREFSAAQRGRPLTLVLFDLDGFKAYNEGYGHRSGDGALQKVAAVLDRNTRRMNVTSRHGGDEFLSVLSGEKAVGAQVFAERTRLGVADLELSEGIKFTVSAGIASYDPSMRDPSDMIDAADRALGRAKALGGNRCYVYVPPTAPAGDGAPAEHGIKA
jgi:diguanylate cyclase (GGDEF)-like protein